MTQGRLLHSCRPEHLDRWQIAQSGHIRPVHHRESVTFEMEFVFGSELGFWKMPWLSPALQILTSSRNPRLEFAVALGAEGLGTTSAPSGCRSAGTLACRHVDTAPREPAGAAVPQTSSPAPVPRLLPPTARPSGPARGSLPAGPAGGPSSHPALEQTLGRAGGHLRAADVGSRSAGAEGPEVGEQSSGDN
ncbi:uncharacterized protein LOC110350366 isoform X2 [Heterocephalus glaber]|uniref:Uncharacterized protein LOC110350366 isoform X2 n=1 Tax=Heterocephalus glaber TaxID=10181 RepID=A0AAX6T811_HETGA|nr:uncharacterized protein LOC110350366 isoform X2 [Heterocephalus glaber]